MEKRTGKMDWFATACLAGAMASWALTPIFLRYLVDYVDNAWTTNGFRYPIGALFYVPFLIAGYRSGRLTRRLVWLAMIPAAVNVVGQSIWAWCPYYADPGVISFLARSTVVWAALGSFLVFRDERVLARSRRFWGGVLLAIGGLGGLVLRTGGGHGRTTALGVGLVLTFAVLWATYGIVMRITVRDSGVGLGFSLVSLYTAVACIVAMLIWGDARQVFNAPVNVSLILIVSAVLGIAIAHGLYYIAIKRLGVSVSQGAGVVSPFLTSSLSFWIFGERLTAGQWTSGIVLVVGAALLVWAQERVVQQRSGDATVGEAQRPAAAARSRTSS